MITIEPNSQEQVDEIDCAPRENENVQEIRRSYWYDFHRRYWNRSEMKSKSNDLLLARILVLFIWFYVILIEFLDFSNLIGSSIALNFLSHAVYPWKDITSIIYGSGAAAYGVSIEIYLIIPLLTMNTIVAVINCHINHSKTTRSLLYMVKVLILFSGTELSHQNFRRFRYRESYQLFYVAATRAMLRQSIYLIITIMFLIAPGLRAIYNAARHKCSYGYEKSNETICQLIEIEKPVIENSDACIADFTAVVTGLEQLRIIRDIALYSIAFYSMYNKAFLDITGSSGIIHKIVLILFLLMSCSFIVANIDPFQFSRLRLIFDLIEILIIIIVIVLLIINLRKRCKHRNDLIMEVNPTIFG